MTTYMIEEYAVQAALHSHLDTELVKALVEPMKSEHIPN